jgi:phosphoribosylformylglycinamidine synthase
MLKKMKARVYITLKKGVLDPQGKAVMGALNSLEFKEVTDVRVGKFMELELEDSSRDKAEKRVRKMCEKLLANPVIEDYRIEIG